MENLSSLGANYRREIACVEIVEASPAVVVTPQRCEATIVVGGAGSTVDLKKILVQVFPCSSDATASYSSLSSLNHNFTHNVDNPTSE